MKHNLIEIFDPKTGYTLFYIRTIAYQLWIEAYMKVFYPDLTSWDYEIAI